MNEVNIRFFRRLKLQLNDKKMTIRHAYFHNLRYIIRAMTFLTFSLSLACQLE
jgi:hypothetical protein